MKLKTTMTSGERRKLIWFILIFLFMGGLKHSELVGRDPKNLDPTKTLRGSNIKTYQGGDTIRESEGGAT